MLRNECWLVLTFSPASLVCLDDLQGSSNGYWYRKANPNYKFWQIAEVWISYNCHRMYSLKVCSSLCILLPFNCPRLYTWTGETIKKKKGTLISWHVYFRFPDKIGGNLPGVHYIRDVADADSLISSLVLQKFLLIIYIFSMSMFIYSFFYCS